MFSLVQCISSFQSVSTQQTSSLVPWLTTRPKSHYHLSIHLSLSVSLSPSACLSVSLSLSLSLIAIVLNFAKKTIIVYLSMSLSIPMSASLNLFSLSFLHIPMAWNQNEIPFMHPSISSFFLHYFIPRPSISVSLTRWQSANLSIYLHVHPSFLSIFFLLLSHSSRCNEKGGRTVAYPSV